MSPARERTSLPEVRETLETARTVAVLGWNPDPSKPAHYVPEYLAGVGYRIIPVNPGAAGRGETYGEEPVRASLADIREPVDVVDVFRRPEKLPEHLDDILAMEPRPALVWLQLGIRNDEFAARLLEAGIEVIQDRCMLADHRRMGVPPKG